MKIEESTENVNLSTEAVQNNKIEKQDIPNPSDIDAFKSALLGKNTAEEETTSSFEESFPFHTLQGKVQNKNEVKNFPKTSNPSEVNLSHPTLLDKSNLKSTTPSLSKETLANPTIEKQVPQTDNDKPISLSKDMLTKKEGKQLSQINRDRSTTLSKRNDSNILEETNTNLPIGNIPEGINKTTSEINTTQEVKVHSTLLAQQIKDQLIDRILVSSSDLNANKEVIVKIAPHLLQATEVHFSKNASMLNIQFTSSNQTSLQFLNANQLDLQAYLQNHLSNKEFSQIHIKVQEGNLTQPQDGRSRNRFEYQSQEEDTEQ